MLSMQTLASTAALVLTLALLEHLSRHKVNKYLKKLSFYGGFFVLGTFYFQKCTVYDFFRKNMFFRQKAFSFLFICGIIKMNNTIFKLK